MKTFIKIGVITADADEYQVPDERLFREAWTFGGNPESGVITVDMEKAKTIWRNKIRFARKDKLEALDAEFMKALETGADTTDIIASKRALRDAPSDPAIESANTPDDLKSVAPLGLSIEEINPDYNPVLEAARLKALSQSLAE
jgi:hypothetical protein